MKLNEKLTNYLLTLITTSLTDQQISPLITLVVVVIEESNQG